MPTGRLRISGFPYPVRGLRPSALSETDPLLLEKADPLCARVFVDAEVVPSCPHGHGQPGGVMSPAVTDRLKPPVSIPLFD